MKKQLEIYYASYNKKKYVHPDPLEFLYLYDAPCDIEIVGLIAASFAFGRVNQIIKAVSAILAKMDKSPYQYINKSTPDSLKTDFKGFKYRFIGETELIAFLLRLKSILKDYNSLENCFASGLNKKGITILPAMTKLALHLTGNDKKTGYIIPDPEKGSACKRLCLFLRWMVRKDGVDPGCWDSISPSKLIVPVDTHMHKIATKLGFTKRKQANMKTAVEITEGFKAICPEDPVKYDFSLTRFGIRDDMEIEAIKIISS